MPSIVICFVVLIVVIIVIGAIQARLFGAVGLGAGLWRIGENKRR